MSKEIELLSEDKLKHYKKGDYSGSHKGMRYYLHSRLNSEEEEERILELWIWQEPYGFAAVPEEEKERFEFPFTEEGLAAAEEKLNERYESDREKYEKRSRLSTEFM